MSDPISRYQAIVIGGGPAGLFAAIRLAQALAAESQARASPSRTGGVLLLERKGKPGRKLLLSGSGQCNITHAGEMADFLVRYGGGAKPETSSAGRAKPEAASRFLKPALYGFTNEDLLAWFRARSIEFETEENGKVFPVSRRAASILQVLLAECENLGVSIETGRRVRSIERLPRATDATGAPDGDKTGGFLLRTELPENSMANGTKTAEYAEYSAPVVLIATGGCSYPGTGSSGDGYALAASLGHRIVPPKPALVSVFVRDFALKDLAGLSFRNAGLTVRHGGKKILIKEGDLLITHEGLSGPLILDASRHIGEGDILEIRFATDTIEEFRSRLDAGLKANPRRLVRTVLADIGLTKSLADRFCENAGIGHDETAAVVTREKRDSLCRFACAYPFQVVRLGDLDTAMATSGGVELSQVTAGTMESRIAPGLFFAGEVLDIDGDTGGYNLQAAFSTGALAARGMATAREKHNFVAK